MEEEVDGQAWGSAGVEVELGAGGDWGLTPRASLYSVASGWSAEPTSVPESRLVGGSQFTSSLESL